MESFLTLVYSDSSAAHSSSTGLRRALRSRVSKEHLGGYLSDARLNESAKYATLPRNFRRSVAENNNNNSNDTIKFTKNPRFIDTMTLPRLNDSFESSFNNSRRSVGSDSELDTSPKKINENPKTSRLPLDSFEYHSSTDEGGTPDPPNNTPETRRNQIQNSLLRSPYRPAVTPRQKGILAARIIELKYNSNYRKNNARKIDLHEQSLTYDESENEMV